MWPAQFQGSPRQTRLYRFGLFEAILLLCALHWIVHNLTLSRLYNTYCFWRCPYLAWAAAFHFHFSFESSRAEKKRNAIIGISRRGMDLKAEIQSLGLDIGGISMRTKEKFTPFADAITILVCSRLCSMEIRKCRIRLCCTSSIIALNGKAAGRVK